MYAERGVPAGAAAGVDAVLVAAAHEACDGEVDPRVDVLRIELHEALEARDGRARLAYENLDEEDDWGRHPLIPLTAELGHEGDTFSFRVDRSELDAIMRERELPPWSGFLWGGLTFYLVRVDGNPRAVSDEVHGYLAMISHPGGHVFESGERQKRDLPTD